MSKPRIFAVITARGGSKRVPGKNIRPVAGKPLLAWTIEAALGAATPFYSIILSTDDEAIAAVGKDYGVEVVRRPDALATDTAKSLPVVQHATRFIEERDKVKMDWVLLLQPTSPLRLPADIDAAVTLTKDADCDSIVSVKESPVHPVFIKKIDDHGLIHPFMLEEPEGLRRQDAAPEAYVRNGAIYLTRRDVLMEQDSLYGKRIRAYLMPQERSLDIDTEHDFRLAALSLAELCAA